MPFPLLSVADVPEMARRLPASLRDGAVPARGWAGDIAWDPAGVDSADMGEAGRFFVACLLDGSKWAGTLTQEDHVR